MLNSKPVNIAICGQVLTGRLEVLERLFTQRFSQVSVIGLSSIFATNNEARFTVYKDGVKCLEKKLFNLIIKRRYPLQLMFYTLAYSIYCICVFSSVIKLSLMRNGLCFVGIGCFYTLLGVVLKKFRLVKKVIYYSIDYFPPVDNNVVVRILVFLDKFCVKGSDIVWLISPRITEARERFGHMPQNSYRHLWVPLTFDESVLKFKEPSKVQRWSIVFVGTYGPFHGLDLLIEAMPKLIKIFPQIKIKLIGPGPWEETKSKVAGLSLIEYFDFLGFIKDENELFETVSALALGMALYSPLKNNPAVYADPGKPKLYTFCSVPAVVSRMLFVAQEIEESGAGRAIDFNVEALVSAITEILSDDEAWIKFRRNAFDFACRYTSQRIFETALREIEDG